MRSTEAFPSRTRCTSIAISFCRCATNFSAAWVCWPLHPLPCIHIFIHCIHRTSYASSGWLSTGRTVESLGRPAITLVKCRQRLAQGFSWL